MWLRPAFYNSNRPVDWHCKQPIYHKIPLFCICSSLVSTPVPSLVVALLCAPVLCLVHRTVFLFAGILCLQVPWLLIMDCPCLLLLCVTQSQTPFEKLVSMHAVFSYLLASTSFKQHLTCCCDQTSVQKKILWSCGQSFWGSEHRDGSKGLGCMVWL